MLHVIPVISKGKLKMADNPLKLTHFVVNTALHFPHSGPTLLLFHLRVVVEDLIPQPCQVVHTYLVLLTFKTNKNLIKELLNVIGTWKRTVCKSLHLKVGNVESYCMQSRHIFIYLFIFFGMHILPALKSCCSLHVFRWRVPSLADIGAGRHEKNLISQYS